MKLFKRVMDITVTLVTVAWFVPGIIALVIVEAAGNAMATRATKNDKARNVSKFGTGHL